MKKKLRIWIFWRLEKVSDWIADQPQLDRYEWMYNSVDRLQIEACGLLGHDPVMDACGIPDHDYCAWCRSTTPGAAHV